MNIRTMSDEGLQAADRILKAEHYSAALIADFDAADKAASQRALIAFEVVRRKYAKERAND